MSNDLRHAAVRTIYTPQDILASLMDLWSDYRSDRPTKSALIVLLAHSACETLHWRECYNNNLGNIKANAATQDHYFITCTELLNPAAASKYLTSSKSEDGVNPLARVVDTRPATATATEKWVVRFWPAHPACCFRHFDTLKEGMDDHFRFLQLPRFEKAFEQVVLGNSAGFCHELALQRYYTQVEAVYTKLNVDVFHMYEKILKDWEPVWEEGDKTLQLTPFLLQDISHDLINEAFYGNSKDEEEKTSLRRSQGVRRPRPQGAQVCRSGGPHYAREAPAEEGGSAEAAP